jgi:transposase
MSTTKDSLGKPLPAEEAAEKTSKKPVLEIATPPQLDMFAGTAQKSSPLSRPSGQARQFRDPNPRDIYLGGRRLDEYLREAGQDEPILIRGFLRTFDYPEFIDAYAPEGRAPYAPAAMLGLILWGLIKGVNSLRGLETLARTDLACMWVSGGITPEFSVIGRFIRRHAEVLTVDFFIELTSKTLKICGSDGSELAGDGTIIQAAASRYRKMTLEAAVEEAAQLTQQVEDQPNDEPKDEGLEQRRDVAQAVADEVSRRAQTRKDYGSDPLKTVISRVEPDAYIQKMKRGGAAPAYTSSILANADRFVLGHAVHPSSETAVVEGMLIEAEKITEGPTTRLLLDGNYLGAITLNLALEKNIDLLIPSKNAKTSSKPFVKERFIYEPEIDGYRCPAGQLLTHVEDRKETKATLAHTRYGKADCISCPFWGKCTKAQRGRTIKRYEHDESKEILREVMSDPRAKKVYSKRQAWVEPVFGELRDIQGLTRFRRMGLEGVHLEFSLHAMAHNLRRMVKVLGRGGAALLLTLLAIFWPRESLSMLVHQAWHISQRFFFPLVRIEHNRRPFLL